MQWLGGGGSGPACPRSSPVRCPRRGVCVSCGELCKVPLAFRSAAGYRAGPGPARLPGPGPKARARPGPPRPGARGGGPVPAAGRGAAGPGAALGGRAAVFIAKLLPRAAAGVIYCCT